MTTEKQNIEVKTLGEQGLKLPILSSKQSGKFTFKEWDMEVEEKLSDIQAKSKSVGEFVRSMMDLLLDSFEGKNWDDYSDEERIIALSSMYFPNMMYMYIALRLEELGHELAFDGFNCPSCKKIITDYKADLRTLEVTCKQGDELYVDYELRRPILWNKKMVTGFRVGIAKWGALESVPAEKAGNGAVVKKAMYESSFISALENGEPIQEFIDIKSIVKKIKKIDIEKIGKVLTENNGGADMTISGECPHCKNEFIKPLDWGYEIFFDSSSL